MRMLRSGAEEALAENRLDDAITAFQRCLQLAPRYHVCAYDLACAYSRKRDAAKAVEWLARAADWGFEDVAELLADTDLTNARSHVRYAQIVEDIQNRLPASKPRPYVAPDQPERGMELVAMLRSELGSGAGIILSHEGNHVYLATASHVVRQGAAEAKTIDVQLKALAPRWHRARLLPPVGDSELDVAILAVDGVELNFCALPLQLGGDAGALRRGDAVYPVGYPGGILWAMPLSADHASQVFPGQISFESQFVRVGFSGGALLNKRGEIVGMITADEPPLGRAVPLALILEAARGAGYPVQLSGPDERAKMPLHVAAKAGDIAAIKRLLENCADPNAVDATGRTALHEAAVQGSADAVRLLLAAGARLHAWAVIRSDDSEREWGTPLHFAAEHGRTEAVKALLVGDDVGLKTLMRKKDERLRSANTALHIVARYDRGDVAEALIAAGGGLEALDRHGRTPLGVAAANGSVGAARVLLRHGAALQLGDHESSDLSPLHLAAAAGKVDVLELFLEHGAEVNATNPRSYAATPLHAAAANGQVQAAAFLIAHKANVDAPGYDGNTPLYYAAKMGTRAVVELLLANGADVKTRSGIAPIEAAAEREDEDVEVLQALVNAKADIGYVLHHVLDMKKAAAARILIKGGADIFLKDAAGRQPLHVAAREGMTEAVDLLLKAGAPVDVADTNGQTPLHLAAANNQPKIVDLLVAAKTPVNARDEAGRTALYIAVAPSQSVVNSAAVVDRLLRAKADPNIEIESESYANTPVAAAASGSADILAMLLAVGGDPNRRGNSTVSPLSLAANRRDAEKKVRMLLKAGAKATVEDGKNSALFEALSNDSTDFAAAPAVIRVLLAAGVPVDPRDEKGRTPLHEAADQRNAEAVKVLLSGGASVDAVDTCGATPLWLATTAPRENEALRVAEILVAAGADVNAKNSCEKGTLLELAEKKGYWKVRQLLLSKGAR